MECLARENAGDTQARFLDEITLEQVEHAGGGINVVDEAHADLTDGGVHAVPLIVGGGIEGAEVSGVNVRTELNAADHVRLGDFFFFGHAGEQVVDALLYG